MQPQLLMQPTNSGTFGHVRHNHSHNQCHSGDVEGARRRSSKHHCLFAGRCARHAFCRQGLVPNPTPHSNTLGPKQHTTHSSNPTQLASRAACFHDPLYKRHSVTPHKSVNDTQRRYARHFTAMPPARQDTHTRTHPLCCCCPLVKTTPTHTRPHNEPLRTHLCNWHSSYFNTCLNTSFCRQRMPGARTALPGPLLLQ